ncbi:MAG: DUF1343 domain-containing protein [Ignavibacteriales bacterium]|nr:DUF1343 domain-containing protein [Ignavibacteriales bacterium]
MRPNALKFFLVYTFSFSAAFSQVKTGADLLFEKHFDLVEEKRLGLITNHSALLSNGKHLADALYENTKTKLIVLFGPEHGIRGDAPDGKSIQHGTDAKTGLHVYSLYGKINKPTPDMLQDVDVLVFDIQDVGARFYTFESTMSLGMEAAAEKGIPYVVLDRPNPIRGTLVEGFVLADSFRSFVGLHPIPIAHAMTIGELATLYNELGWLKNGVKADLKVVKMDGWRREMWFDATGLTWVRPSPNMATLKTATVYPGTCLIEGTNISEGRGTERPFEFLGAPYIDGKEWAQTLNSFSLSGVTFEPTDFTPREIPHVTSNPKHKGLKCGGVFVNVWDREKYEPVKTAVHILASAKKLYPKSFQWRNGLERLAGTARLRQSIDAGVDPAIVAESWKEELEKFSAVRKKYLLY